jgi:hypothetical protein
MSSAPHTQTSTDTDTAPSAPSRVVRVVRIVAVAAAAVVAAFVAWLVLGRSNGNGARTSTEAAPPGIVPAVAKPSIASVGELRAVAEASPVPIYWIGIRRRTKIELTRAPGGIVFIRYLPPHVQAGDTRAFLTIATYPRAKAYAEVERAATASTTKTIDLAGGGIAVYDTGQTSNVHLAYPGQPYQIEVFAPRQAVHLVESGAVRPVG